MGKDVWEDEDFRAGLRGEATPRHGNHLAHMRGRNAAATSRHAAEAAAALSTLVAGLLLFLITPLIWVIRKVWGVLPATFRTGFVIFAALFGGLF
jgi:hypothetical protein